MQRMLGAAVVLLASALTAGAALAQGDPYVEAGERLYHQHCGSCHGMGGTGNGPVAALLDPKPADLTRIAARRDGVFPEAEMLEIIDGRDPIQAHGSREMPVWGKRFSEGPPPGPAPSSMARGQVMLLLHYLKTIQQTP